MFLEEKWKDIYDVAYFAAKKSGKKFFIKFSNKENAIIQREADVLRDIK